MALIYLGIPRPQASLSSITVSRRCHTALPSAVPAAGAVKPLNKKRLR